MKKFYSVLALSVIALGVSAQCTINQSVFSGPNDYRILPDTVTNLPVATVGVGYAADLQFHVQPDTTVTTPIPGTYTITHVQIDSIVGIPANFSYSTNPSNGIFPGGSYGCAGVTGLAVAGQESGGPASNGVYPIIIYLTAVVDFFSVPTPIPFTKTGYNVVIQASNNVPAMANVNFTVNQNAPNPSDKSTEFIYTNPSTGNVQFTLYNVLGETVRQQNIYSVKGENRYTLHTADLSAGVYLCTFRAGNVVITRRMTVAH